MKKEIGIPNTASKKLKAADEMLDRRYKLIEGSPADLKMDKKLMDKSRATQKGKAKK